MIKPTKYEIIGSDVYHICPFLIFAVKYMISHKYGILTTDTQRVLLISGPPRCAGQAKATAFSRGRLQNRSALYCHRLPDSGIVIQSNERGAR